MNIALTRISGGWQRLTLSGWIVAALLLLAYNGTKMMVLLSPPITGRSMEVKLASQKWRQLQDKISHGDGEYLEAVDLDMALLGIPADSDSNNPEPASIPPTDLKDVEQTKIRLPVLSGILQNTDIHGRAFALAIIDGHRLKTSDKIRGFKVQKISNDGVVVARDGRKWFLSAPRVPYTRVQVSGAESDGSNQSMHRAEN